MRRVCLTLFVVAVLQLRLLPRQHDAPDEPSERGAAGPGEVGVSLDKLGEVPDHQIRPVFAKRLSLADAVDADD